MGNFQKIHDMQYELNKLIGIETRNGKNKIDWLYNFCQAIEDEICEAKNCINWKWWAKESKDTGQFSVIFDPKNFQIELIDILHFQLCIQQITEMASEVDSTWIDQNEDTVDTNSSLSPFELFKILELMHNCVRNMKNTLTNYDVIDDPKDIITFYYPELICASVYELWNLFINALKGAGMTPYRIFDVYSMKMEANIARQKNNYALLTKTEDDNNEIKSHL